MSTIELFLACILAGMVNSVAGGGILVVFPALLTIGLPPINANATSNLISWPGALSSAYAYRAQLRKLPAKYLFLLLPCFGGALVGAFLLEHTDSRQFSRLVPYLVLGAVLLFIFQPYLHRQMVGNFKAHRTAPIALLGLALIPMAVYGGYFGAGFGFIMLAFLGFTKLTDIHQINGLKNLAGATITLTCTVYFGLTGLIDWHFAPLMISGSLIGGYSGARISQKINPALVHSGIIVLGLGVAIWLFVKALH